MWFDGAGANDRIDAGGRVSGPYRDGRVESPDGDRQRDGHGDIATDGGREFCRSLARCCSNRQRDRTVTVPEDS